MHKANEGEGESFFWRKHQDRQVGFGCAGSRPLPQHFREDFSLLRRADGIAMAKLSPQQLLTAQRFLVQELEFFSPAYVSAGIIQELKFDKNNPVPRGSTCTTATIPSATSSSCCRAAWRRRSGTEI
ncbi:metal transporter CNNM3-like isoform X2 [Strix uralensis]|uniref:metal transporter CNNM3-like isoform X2 n=1 Tax=Strix uralensis TaxID=36305 RepID=UPI003DA70588